MNFFTIPKALLTAIHLAGFLLFGGSTAGTTISINSPSQTLTLGADTWSMGGCQVFKNGSVVSNGSNWNIQKIAKVSGSLYFYGNGGNWYTSSWTGTTDPGAGQIITGSGQPGPQISDSAGNVWDIQNCTAFKNGLTTNLGPILHLLSTNGVVYAHEWYGGWRSWDGVSTWSNPIYTSPLGAMGDGLTASTSAQAVFDVTGVKWTVVSGTAYRNGVAAGTLANVGMLHYVGGIVYAQDTTGAFYQWLGSAWSSRIASPYGQPKIAEIINVSAGSGNHNFSDATGNMWYVAGGSVGVNEGYAGTTSNVTQLVYLGVPSKSVYAFSSPNWLKWDGTSSWNVSASPNVSFTPTAGVCGSANGSTVSSAPSTNLCGDSTLDTASNVTSTGPWYWTCTRDAPTPCAAFPSTGRGTPAIPAQASAAGFTTPILDQEFDTTTLSLTCAASDPTTGTIWHQGMWWETPAPCGQIFRNYIPDFFQTVLDMKWLRSTTPANNDVSITTLPWGLSGSIPSHFAYKYGYAEIVARVTVNASGIWPAPLWANGDTTNPQAIINPSGTNGDYPEFDISEWLGKNSGLSPGVSFSTESPTHFGQTTHEWHWSGATQSGTQITAFSFGSDNTFYDITLPHAYGMLWTATQVCYYVDNVQQGCHAADAVTNHEPIYLIVTMGFGCGYASTDISCVPLTREDLLISRIIVWQ